MFTRLGGIPEPPEGYVPPLGASRNTWTNIYKNKGRIDYCVAQFGVSFCDGPPSKYFATVSETRTACGASVGEERLAVGRGCVGFCVLGAASCLAQRSVFRIMGAFCRGDVLVGTQESHAETTPVRLAPATHPGTRGAYLGGRLVAGRLP